MVSGESIWRAAAGFPLEAGLPRVFVFTGKSVDLVSGAKNLLIFTIVNYNVNDRALFATYKEIARRRSHSCVEGH